MGLNRNKMQIPVTLDAEALFELFREQIAAMVAAEVERQVAERLDSMRPDLPEVLTPDQARKYAGVKDLRTLRKRFPDAATISGGRPAFLKSKIG